MVVSAIDVTVEATVSAAEVTVFIVDCRPLRSGVMEVVFGVGEVVVAGTKSSYFLLALSKMCGPPNNMYCHMGDGEGTGPA